MADSEPGTTAELAGLLRQLRRRESRERGGAELTYRELAARTGWSHAAVGEYLTGKRLPPADRLDALAHVLKAKPSEMRMLATLRDRIEESRRLPQAGSHVPHVPHEMPPPPSGFTGRAAELAAIDRYASTVQADNVPGVLLLSGTPGAGKTALAVHWAQLTADRYPDGQLYVDLHGYGPDDPLAPDVALARLLRSLGVDSADLPADLAERAALYRTKLAGKRVLLILDNAGAADQVRHLLPGTGVSTAVVTSRDSLPGLVAREGARRIELGALPSPDSISLLRKLIGSRVDEQPEAAAALAEQCARIPLALRLAAELAEAQPATQLSELLGEQGDLDRLDAGGDPATAMRTVFSGSYRWLDPEASQAFKLLGLHPGTQFDVFAVAALTSSAVDSARLALLRLRRAHLVEPAGGDRYRMHDLLRAYAAELAGDEPADTRAVAVGRLLDYYFVSAAAAMNVLFPLEQADRPQLPKSLVEVPSIPTPESAKSWLDRERYNLIAIAGSAAAGDRASHSVLLSRVLWRYFDAYSYFDEASAVHASALRATAEPRHAAEEMANVGLAHWRLGRLREALDVYGQACLLFRQAGDREGEARVLGNLGIVLHNLGRYTEALEHHRLSLAIYRELGDQRHEGIGLNNIGVAYESAGNYGEAAVHHQQAADLAMKIGDRRLESHAVGALSVACRKLGRYTEALEFGSRALAISRETGDRHIQSGTLASLGEIHAEQGQTQQALTYLEQAIAIAEYLNEPYLTMEVRCALGETLNNSGHPRRALPHYETALRLAREIESKHHQAQVLTHLGQAAFDLRQTERAHAYWVEAHLIYAELGLPEQEIVREKLRWTR